jgi:hypothetical protein
MACRCITLPPPRNSFIPAGQFLHDSAIVSGCWVIRLRIYPDLMRDPDEFANLVCVKYGPSWNVDAAIDVNAVEDC